MRRERPVEERKKKEKALLIQIQNDLKHILHIKNNIWTNSADSEDE